MQIKKETAIRARALLDAGEQALSMESPQVAAALLREGLCLMLRVPAGRNSLEHAAQDRKIYQMAVDENNKIGAIKYARSVSKMTLKEAKEYVENVMKSPAA